MSTKSVVRRVGRALAMVLVGYPYCIVVIPVTIGLLIHAVDSLISHHALMHLHWAGWAQCAGLIVGLFLFALLSLVYLAALVWVGWKANGSQKHGP